MLHVIISNECNKKMDQACRDADGRHRPQRYVLMSQALHLVRTVMVREHAHIASFMTGDGLGLWRRDELTVSLVRTVCIAALRPSTNSAIASGITDLLVGSLVCSPKMMAD